MIKSLGLSVFYSLPFGITVAWRLLNYAIVGAVEIVLLCILLKSKQLLTQINKITPFSLGVKFKSTSEISEYAKGISGVFSKPGLERVVALCEALGSPQKKVKVIHVTGTNGKGSTSAFLCSILRSAGLRVGAFNSPYLIEMREAIRIDGDEISEERLSELFDRIRPIADSLTDKPTEFELLTAAAYLAFSEAKVDVAVVECGMGARRDATNVIDSPLLSIITGVSVDHTAYLGSTLSDIAKEKTGVIKRGCPVLVGDTDPSCMNIIKEEASRLSSHVLYPDTPSVKELSQNGTLIDCGHLKNIKISLLGIHQPKNASLAIAAAKYLRERFPTLTDEAIRQGISDTVWKGRFEILGNAPTFIFDGAHNLEGIKSAVASIRAYFGKVVCLTGVLKDKEYVAMADEIATVANTVVTVTPNNPRALSADEYAKVFAARGTPSYPESSVQSATNTAISLSREGNIPVVCLGSLYLYKDVVNALKNIKNDK